MGLRFKCHHCGEELNVKNYLAGKRGKCPNCSGSFRIPQEGLETSQDVSVKFPGQIATEQHLDAEQYAMVGAEASDQSGNDLQATEVSTSSRAERRTGPVGVSTPKAESRPTESPVALPKAIAEAPDAAWFVRPPSGGEYGPAIGTLLATWLDEQRVGAAALVWREGWPQWQCASEVFPEKFEKPTPPVAPPQASAPASIPSPVTPASRLAASPQTRLQQKKRKSQKQQAMIFAILAVIAIGLVTALIIVLMNQGKTA